MLVLYRLQPNRILLDAQFSGPACCCIHVSPYGTFPTFIKIVNANIALETNGIKVQFRAD